MKTDRPSRTAEFVALGRALADAGLSHVPGFRDPAARVFLDENGRRSVAKMEKSARETPRGIRIDMARVMADMIALRTTAIDAAVRGAIARGVKQLVILGAGYDGRAWRMAELSGVSVFEIDHPATQAQKRARLAELPSPIGSVTFVSLNFERESLDAALSRAGHDRSSPTCWIWEGVVMYLTHETMRRTLESVARSSAPGSTVIVNYHTAHRRFFARLMFRLIGEPQISAWTRDQMAAALRSAGFEVREDSNMADWNGRFADGRAKVARGVYMRIAVAQHVSA